MNLVVKQSWCTFLSVVLLVCTAWATEESTNTEHARPTTMNDDRQKAGGGEQQNRQKIYSVLVGIFHPGGASGPKAELRDHLSKMYKKMSVWYVVLQAPLTRGDLCCFVEILSTFSRMSTLVSKPSMAAQIWDHLSKMYVLQAPLTRDDVLNFVEIFIHFF